MARQRSPYDAYQAFESAIASFVGWTLIYLAAWSVAFAVGAAIGTESVTGLGHVIIAPVALVFLPFAAFTDITLLVGTLLVPALWALPLYYDWHRPRPLLIVMMLPFAGRLGYWTAALISLI